MISNKRKASTENSIMKFFKSSSADRLKSPSNESPINETAMSTPSAFETYSIQIDPSNGANLFEFNKHPIQPMIRFPKNARDRKFVYAWYTKHKWLEYSVMEDKAYCHFCRIFSRNKDLIFGKSGFND